jgi:hypothetical protein
MVSRFVKLALFPKEGSVFPLGDGVLLQAGDLSNAPFRTQHE